MFGGTERPGLARGGREAITTVPRVHLAARIGRKRRRPSFSSSLCALSVGSLARYPALSVRFTTVAALRTWNSVLPSPKCRLCGIPNYTSRAIRCSTTTRWR